MYQGIRKKRRDPFKYIRKTIVAFMILAYPVTWMVSINKGLRMENESWYLIGYIIFAFCSFLLTLLFIVYAILLIRYVDRPNKSPENFSFESVAVKTPQNISINLRENLMEKEEWLDIISFDSKSFSKSSIDFETNKVESPYRKTEIVDDRYFLQFSEEDKKIIKKLLAMTTAAGISGLLIIAVGTPFTVKKDLSSPALTYFGIFLAFAVEVGICFLVGIAFTTQIKNPEKENIKQTAYIARIIRNKAPKIKISRQYKNISRRLRLYYS